MSLREWIVGSTDDVGDCGNSCVSGQKNKKRSCTESLRNCKSKCSAWSNGSSRDGSSLCAGYLCVDRGIDQVVPAVAGIVTKEAASKEQKTYAEHVMNWRLVNTRCVHNAEEVREEDKEEADWWTES